MSILSQGNQVGDYTVEYLIKANAYCESYRVADADNNPFFLKLYILKNTPDKLLTDDRQINEIVYCKQLRHKNIISFITSGTLMMSQAACDYMITTYFSGMMLSTLLEQRQTLSAAECKSLIGSLLDALRYMHDEMSLMHNDITLRNVMIAPDAFAEPQLIDMGHVSRGTNGIPAFDTSDLDLRYCANQTFAGMYDESTDVFSVVVLMYTLLAGAEPWQVDAGLPRNEQIKHLKKLRKEAVSLEAIPQEFRDVISRGLSTDRSERFQTARQLQQALRQDEEPEERDRPGASARSRGKRDDNRTQARERDETAVNVEVKKGQGNGFKDIAGMEDMKDLLNKRVIFILRDRELAEKYRLTPPNGMLLYGPPGCGKSFFAEKFAEETGFNFMLVKASDLGSVYIHGTQGKIAELFKKAEKNAPTVLCFDEFDAFVPNRSDDFGNHHSGEVNEFLSQLNNCSHRGIFVIATSNRPDKIDPAVLRTGRIDKMIYVPLPDQVARREMLKLHMQGRPCDEMDYEKLATLSEGYVASDITYVVNEAAMIAAFNGVPISQQLMETTIGGIKPSVKGDALKEYDKIRDKMEGSERRNSLPRIGFTAR